MGIPSALRTPSSREAWLALAVFAACLGFHFRGALVGWQSRNLPGVEYRQAQTAISAFYINQEDNFSLAYPTPVLGKPWSIPLEFPLYQWTVVSVSRVTGLSLTKAGRAVSLACFYLMLPAIYLLLARGAGAPVAGAGGGGDVSALRFLFPGLPDRDHGADVQRVVLGGV